MPTISAFQGDITQCHLDAVVNAANSNLRGGGGVDGAIHKAAGPRLLKETKLLGKCPVGEARITEGHQLNAKHIIHTVGPVWEGGEKGEEEKLRQCYYSALSLAQKHRIRTIAFPCISTGAYGYPKPEAARVAVNAVREFFREHHLIEQIYFVCYDEENLEAYQKLLRLKKR